MPRYAFHAESTLEKRLLQLSFVFFILISFACSASYAASALVKGDIPLLVPLTHTRYLDGHPAVFFSEQQGQNGVELLDKVDSILITSSVEGLILDLVRDRYGVSLDENGRGTWNTATEGMHELWARISEEPACPVRQVITIDGESLVLPLMKGRWFKGGEIRLESGKHEISVSCQDEEQLETSVQGLEIVVVPESTTDKYRRVIAGKDYGYLFCKEEKQGNISTEANDSNDFVTLEAEAWMVSALLRPREENIEACAFDHWLYGAKDIESAYDFRKKPHLADARALPVLFGENFYKPQNGEPRSIEFMEGKWRLMGDDGNIILMNPVSSPISASMVLHIVSFEKDRIVELVRNGKPVYKTNIPRMDREREGTSGPVRPVEVRIQDLTLAPGVNELAVSVSPSATLLETEDSDTRSKTEDRRPVSIAIREDIQVIPVASENGDGWTNRDRDSFEFKAEHGALILEDHYQEKEAEIAWIIRAVDSVLLEDYSFFDMTYRWRDSEMQAMDVGFRIDTDGDGQGDRYFTRSLPPPSSGTTATYKCNLLEACWELFPDEDNYRLVGIDIFPHKKWGLDATRGRVRGWYNYYMYRMRLFSDTSCLVVKDRAPIGGSRKSESNDHHVSLWAGGDRGSVNSKTLTVSLNSFSMVDTPYLIIPYALDDARVQDVEAFISFDTDGDGQVDKVLPAGKCLTISHWKLLDVKDSMVLYEAQLPSQFPLKCTTRGKRDRGFVVYRDGRRLEPTWKNDWLPGRNQVQVGCGKEGQVVVNLPEGTTPGAFNYEIFYTPEEWVCDSARYSGYKELRINLADLAFALNLRRQTARALEVRLRLTVNIEEAAIEELARYNFHFKDLEYARAVLPRDVRLSENIPDINLDGRPLEFQTKPVDKNGSTFGLETTVSLTEGSHYLRTVEKGALEPYIIEIKPANKQLTANPETTPEIAFEKVNPTRYIVNVKNAYKPFWLVFSESFHEGWKAYARASEVRGQRSEASRGQGNTDEPWSALLSAWQDRGNRVELKDHHLVNGYANAWWVDVNELKAQSSKPKGSLGDEFEIVLEFKPQRLFEIGLLISGTTFLACILYLGYSWQKNRRKRRNRT